MVKIGGDGCGSWGKANGDVLWQHSSQEARDFRYEAMRGWKTGRAHVGEP